MGTPQLEWVTLQLLSLSAPEDEEANTAKDDQHHILSCRSKFDRVQQNMLKALQDQELDLTKIRWSEYRTTT